jgi:Ca2+-binding RTX toxin-like protein
VVALLDEDSEGAVEDSTLVDGGPGDDRIVGSRFDDFIVPGSGRDKVFARGGPDWISADADAADDHLRGGGGGDALYTGSADDAVDLAARTLTSAGQSDSVAGFERVHTGGGADTLRGGDRAEALYGGGGTDTVDGRGGRDLLFGDSPQTSQGESSPNTIIGGDGDDYVDARSRNPVPTTSIECGAGNDIFTGEVDDRPDPSCELVAFRFGSGDTFFEDPPDFDHGMRAFPVAREPDGDPVYALACPPANRPPNSGCSGTIALSDPADPNATYGSAPFAAGPGQTANVAVPLNAAGQAAVGAGRPVAARVSGEAAPPPGSGAPSGAFTFGWQHVVGP